MFRLDVYLSDWPKFLAEVFLLVKDNISFPVAVGAVGPGAGGEGGVLGPRLLLHSVPNLPTYWVTQK